MEKEQVLEEAAVKPLTIKNFKSSSEMETFYRFVHENGLRHEAKTLLKTLHSFHYQKKRRSKKDKILQ